jgi:hypothetical protein
MIAMKDNIQNDRSRKCEPAANTESKGNGWSEETKDVFVVCAPGCFFLYPQAPLLYIRTRTATLFGLSSHPKWRPKEPSFAMPSYASSSCNGFALDWAAGRRTPPIMSGNMPMFWMEKWCVREPRLPSVLCLAPYCLEERYVWFRWWLTAVWKA